MGAQWKHKGKQESASAKGKIFSKLAKAIIMAAKGGADPTLNAKLRIAVDAAKKASLPRDTLERAIKKGAGLLDEQVSYDTVVFEGFGPHRVPVIVECLTDNKNRTTPNMRFHFKKGQLGTTGSVSWDFSHLGMIEATPPPDADPEVAAIEAGAQDLEPADDGATRFFTEPADVDAVTKALTAAGWTVTSAVLGWKAKNPVTLDDAARAEVEAWLHEVDEDDDVQQLYVGLA
ncbi:MAG: YebC/PmpR family DNA-binding transcriptional regulator [Myxococcales bacterium]|nr:YebC/PmpR family DNA-binding transcriptional regulator [Myxococcales bacterium]